MAKFVTVVTSATITAISETIAAAFEKILIFKPQLEAMLTHQGQLVFREDWHYYQEGVEGAENGTTAYDPFRQGPNIDGDVIRCDEDTTFCLNKSFLQSIWHSLDYAFIPNPLLTVMVAEFLTFSLNENQDWIKRHEASPTHFMQNYVNLQALILNYAPHLIHAYHNLEAEVISAREDFKLEVARQKGVNHILLSNEEVQKMYEARGARAEEVAIQDFWDSADIQDILNDFQVAFDRIVRSLFPTINAAAERSLMPGQGYDVFSAVAHGQKVFVKRLGDYRILHWELNQL